MYEAITLYDGIKEDWTFADVEGLQTYLNEVWRNRPLFLSEGENEEERKGTEQKFFTFSEKSITPKNYVGFVQYGGLRLNIYPRVFYQHPQFDPLLVVNHVLKWLSYGSRIHFPFSELPLQIQAKDDWLEALIFLFANYTLDSLSNSPHFTYQEITEQMNFLRGKIAMQDYINNNLAKGRHHLLHCIYEPFLYDNLFNRIVKHTCRLLQSVSFNSANQILLNDTLFLLDEVSDMYCTVEHCTKVPVNRLYPEVGIITNMCSALLSNQVYSDGIISNQNLCILLPMEVIYEQYIAGFLLKHFPDLNVKSQASDMYVAKTGKDFSKDVFRMKHDILLPDKKVIDTKYKYRYSSDDLKGAVSQNDLYQMVTYCYKRKMKNGMLLYPKHCDEDANNERHNFKVEDMLINARSIDITENEFEKFDELQTRKFREIVLHE